MHSNSKERGMIFNSEMVRAILSGQKTQTRRIMKNQPAGDYPDAPVMVRNIESGFQWHGKHGESSVFPCPLGTVGDRIWVRETWAEAGGNAPELQLYRASYPDHVPSRYENMKPLEEIRWTPSIHMPRWASRILLEITNVRVERLNDISNEDAKAEGYPAELAADGGYYDPFLWFRNLWDGIYPEQSFKHNPWVWVIEFKRVQEQSND